MTVRHGEWIQTFGGRQFWPLDPRPEEIHIHDIAHALSMQCRFAGHTKYHYSVAQHSVLVSELCDPEHALCGLLHDATEAYLVDLPTPVKQFMPDYKAYEEKLWLAVAERFGLPGEMPQSVKKADMVALATEARDLMGPRPKEWRPMPAPAYQKIQVMTPTSAELAFLARFFELGGK